MAQTTNDYDDWDKDDLQDWAGYVARAEWAGGSACRKVQAAAEEVMANSGLTALSPDQTREFLVWGDLKPHKTGRPVYGFHSVFYRADGTEDHHLLVIERDTAKLSIEDQWKTFLHEVGHHIGGMTEYEAEYTGPLCAPWPGDEPENEDDGGGGGVGGGGGTWVWVPATEVEVCESYVGGDSPCEKVSGENPDGGDSYYVCEGISNPDTVCWHEIVEPGSWVWLTW